MAAQASPPKATVQQLPPDFRRSNLLMLMVHLVHTPRAHIHQPHTHPLRILLAHSLPVSRRHPVRHHQVDHLALVPTHMDDAKRSLQYDGSYTLEPADDYYPGIRLSATLD
jgi:hypothetical protein